MYSCFWGPRNLKDNSDVLQAPPHQEFFNGGGEADPEVLNNLFLILKTTPENRIVNKM
jgi:hypothetical protein